MISKTEMAVSACSTITDVSKCVDDFWMIERHPSVESVKFAGPVTLDDAYNSEMGHDSGCYAIFAEDYTLLYVGMSQKSMISRIRSHLSRSVQRSDFWSRLPQPFFVGFAQTGQAWESLAIEAYLNQYTKNLWSHRMDVIRVENPSLSERELANRYRMAFANI